MENVEFHHEPYGRKRIKIYAFEGRRRIGSIDYLPSSQPARPVEIGLLQVRGTHWGKGIARALLRELVADIAIGTRIVADVTHEDTWKYFERLNPDLENTKRHTLVVTEQNLIKEVPITRVLKSGGIDVVRFNVTYTPKEGFTEFNNGIYRIFLRGLTSE